MIDKTAEIVDEYARKYPTVVKAIHQENGGHGKAVNAGIRNASGLYFKVVDSDDWVDVRTYLKMLKILNDFEAEARSVDMVISNFVCEKEGSKYRKIMNYEDILPEGRVFSWDDIKSFCSGQYILMHSVIYKTQLLIECGLELPKHTFYVDNLFVYVPLEHVKKMYYINVDFYRYFIGRLDQSVNESVMIKGIDQQIKVNKLMIEQVHLENIEDTKLRQYMLNHLAIVTTVSKILLIRSGTSENLKKKKELWKYIKDKDIELYNDFWYGFLGYLVNLPGRIGRSVSVCVYKI